MATRQNRSLQADVDGSHQPLTYTAADDESVSEAVIAALRDAAGVADSDASADVQSVGTLTPLFETIDPDALNALFSPTHNGDTRTGSVTFTHDGYEVTVTGAGEVTVSRPAAGSGPD